MKRIFDLFLGVLAALILAIPIIILAIMVRFTSIGPVLYWSKRVGKNNVIFEMPKFRSMRLGTPTVATDLLENPHTYLTPMGGFIRKSSLDELPQLWCVIRGDMSFVGPRPALFNQTDLIELRRKWGVDALTPGITGWAQIGGRDEVALEEKVRLDVEYLYRQSFLFDIKIIMLTFIKVIRRDGIAH